jgi:glycine oxidase
MTTDVIVIGGGVIGCTIAWRLAQQGLKVTLLERDRIGCEASRAAAGMLSPQSESQTSGPFFDLCLRSRSIYRRFADELGEASGIDVEYNDDGTLFVVSQDEDQQEKTAWTSWQIDAGLSVERLTPEDAKRLEPAITRETASAVFLPDEHQVENRRLMDALQAAMKRVGVQVLEGGEASSFITAHGRVAGVGLRRERLDSGAVVVAAGAWSGSLLDRLNLNVELIPARGQMIALKGETSPIKRVLHSSEVYIVPRRDGRLLVGATVEYAGFQKAVTVTGVNRLLSAAIKLVPSLGGFEIVETWSGIRPDTVDHLPIMGPSGIDNLFLATGHFRNGILLAPITADLMSELIVLGRIPEQLEPFGVERFDRGQPEAFQ